jgi:hypothetical protein
MTEPKKKPKPGADSKPKTPARPPVQLQYLLWDGTDPVDSKALGQGLEKRFRWLNLLVDSPKAEEFVIDGPPRIFQPDDESALSAAEINRRFLRGILEFPRTFFDPVHNNVGSDRPNLLAYSGHGMPGFMFGHHDVLICSSRPVTPDAAPNAWRFDRRPVRPSPAFKWDHPSIKIVLMSACRQFQGRPQQFFWSQAMRGSNPVHMILGYRETAPAASSSSDINRIFLKNLFGTNGKNGQKILDAWNNAHIKVGLTRSWAALCYKSSRSDRLDDWTRTGKLASTPDPKEDILYFDSANLSGRVVTEPHQDLDCFLTARGHPIPLPPWMFIPSGTQLDLHVQFIDPKQSFQDSDEVWIAAIQVRPDFEAHFDISELIPIDLPPADSPLLTGEVQTNLLAHTNFGGFQSDTYVFKVDRKAISKFVKFDATFNELTIPIKIGKLDNDRHRPCYFMIRVSNLDAPASLKLPRREFGIPTVGTGLSRKADLARLIDDFQFSVFLPPWP